jgi:hypothetical protein
MHERVRCTVITARRRVARLFMVFCSSPVKRIKERNFVFSDTELILSRANGDSREPCPPPQSSPTCSHTKTRTAFRWCPCRERFEAFF